jgi:hypothetical protein
VSQHDVARAAVAIASALLLIAVAWWIVVPVHRWSGPIIWMATYKHGVHRGDLLAIPILIGAVACLVFAGRAAVKALRPPVTSPGARNGGGRRPVG